MNDALVNDAVN